MFLPITCAGHCNLEKRIGLCRPRRSNRLLRILIKNSTTYSILYGGGGHNEAREHHAARASRSRAALNTNCLE